MPKPLIIITAVFAVVTTAGFAAAQEPVQVAMGTPVVWTANATPATTATTISIVNNPGGNPTARFVPETLEISVGTTVIWTNLDSSIEDNLHTATSHARNADDSRLFDSDTLDPGVSFSYTFNTADEFTYFCGFHNDMTGTVKVS